MYSPPDRDQAALLKFAEVARSVLEQINTEQLPKTHLRLVSKQWLDKFVHYALTSQVSLFQLNLTAK